ncbi:uncharacterized mitochondrial protein AtMg00810 [Lathyrus oleraceus]|uniref:uncharacterized mitochondrial protein AtMg00810 n=1 Tax=Pisum sativum TaxID=3888 RepID=UPI0021CE83B3|nr:uncharacterized mitochondrial protein AtMg00810-like [Pisum sativum]
MQQPPGFEHDNKELVCKLNKALCDHSLFTYNHQGITLYVLVYVDDILITGSSSLLVHKLITQLNQQFALKQLGKPEYFLGLEVAYQANGSIILTQTKYIRDLLSRFHMEEANGVPSPMLSNSKLSKYGTDYIEDPLQYRSVVGAL